MSIISIHNQNLFDVALQQFGAAEAVMDIALLNDLSITDMLPVGTALLIGTSAYTNTDISEYYNRKSLRPATGNWNDSHDVIPVGIGSMQIQGITNKFKIG